jgi:aldehyde dehydrogenase (NAD+)
VVLKPAPQPAALGGLVAELLAHHVPESCAGVLAREEVFRPVAAVMTAGDAADAVRIADATRSGRSGAIFTQDLSRAMGFAERLEAGLVRVNAPTSAVDLHAPSGGTRDSSYGPREQGLGRATASPRRARC